MSDCVTGCPLSIGPWKITFEDGSVMFYCDCRQNVIKGLKENELDMNYKIEYHAN